MSINAIILTAPEKKYMNLCIVLPKLLLNTLTNLMLCRRADDVTCLREILSM